MYQRNFDIEILNLYLMESIFIKNLMVLSFLISVNIKAGEPNKQISFTENKGQVCDQNGNLRPDVLFSGKINDLIYHLTTKGISYQLHKVDSWKTSQEKASIKVNRIPDHTSVYRVDINWKGMNNAFTINKGYEQEGYDNFYLSQCPIGVINVKSYNEVTYSNIYNGIDLKWYEKNGQLEYDFIVKPNADPSQIKIEIKGATKLSINKNGELEIKTPFGIIVEKSPVAYQGNKLIKSNWQLIKNELSFKLSDYNSNLPLVIDPVVRVWGTYYGGAAVDFNMDTETDPSGNVFTTGYTSTSGGITIATLGAYQSTFGGGTYDAFLVKFTSAGARVFGTYYGGPNSDYSYSCSYDGSANQIYIAGYTQSTTGISTLGSHQPVIGGLGDAFLAKFSSVGALSWATYYGGQINDYGYSCSVEVGGGVYMGGTTYSSVNIGTPGTFQPSYSGTGSNSDGFLVKFNSIGVRTWGTYYGAGASGESIVSCASDPTGNIYITGSANPSSTVLTTAGCHQSLPGGGNDAYLAKFQSNGLRTWSTIYGGAAADDATVCAVDASGNVYLGGSTTGTSPIGVIASAAAHQTIFAGGFEDGFLSKFNSLGVRQWGTFYGGSGDDGITGCAFDPSGNVYISGFSSTPTSTVIATSGSYQQTFGGGGADAMLAEFSAAGIRTWGSYYGGSGTDIGNDCTLDLTSNIYITGRTASLGNIASVGSHQPTNAGGTYDGFLAKFTNCANLTVTIVGSSTLCSGTNLTLTASGAGMTTYTWSTGATSSSIVISPTVNTTYTITSGTATAGCIYTDVQTVSVSTTPTVNISAGSLTVCSGSSTNLTAIGASTYTWNTGATTTLIAVSPTITTIYTATGTAANSCKDTQTISISAVANPTVNITASSATLCSGSSSSLTASGASTYSWSTGATTTVIAVSPTITTIYTATGTSVAGCKDTQTLSLTVTTTPTLVTNNYTICAGGTATLIASGATTYSWNTGATTPSITVTPTANIVYTITGSNGACTDVNTVSVTVGSSLSIVVTPSVPAICIGNSGTLTASGAITYTWSTGSNSTSVVISPTINTTYTVNGTSGACAGSKTITMVVNLNPTVTASSSSSLICTGNSASLTASGASIYVWNPGSLPGTPVVVSPTLTTTYSVTGTSIAGCTNTKTISITVSVCPGINEINNSSNFNIYPNPNYGEFTLIVKDYGIYTIINSIGQTVETIEIKDDSQEINLNGFAAGIYYLIGKTSKAKIVVTK